MTDHTRTKGWKRRERNKIARAAGDALYAKTMLLYGYDTTYTPDWVTKSTIAWQEANRVARKVAQQEQWRWYKEVLKP